MFIQDANLHLPLSFRALEEVGVGGQEKLCLLYHEKLEETKLRQKQVKQK